MMPMPDKNPFSLPLPNFRQGIRRGTERWVALPKVESTLLSVTFKGLSSRQTVGEWGRTPFEYEDRLAFNSNSLLFIEHWKVLGYRPKRDLVNYPLSEIAQSLFASVSVRAVVWIRTTIQRDWVNFTLGADMPLRAIRDRRIVQVLGVTDPFAPVAG